MPTQLLNPTPAERIRVRYAAGDGTRIFRSSDAVLIGRDHSCDLRLEDLHVDRHHAEVYRNGELWWVRDLGSADGTYLDDECIEVCAGGRPGDAASGHRRAEIVARARRVAGCVRPHGAGAIACLYGAPFDSEADAAAGRRSRGPSDHGL